MGPELSFSDFIGVYWIAPRAPSAPADFDRLSEGIPYGRYKIHAVCTCAKQAGRRWLPPVPPLPGSAATLDGEIVGTSQFRHTWVHPEHRGRGLGSELLVQLYLAVPEIYLQRRPGQALSPGGVRAVERAYYRLVELGAIVNPELSSVRSD